MLETGEYARCPALAGARTAARAGDRQTGYHRLLIDDREIVLAVAPSRCRTIDDAVPDARLWGIAAQVYALRHRGDGGIGDAAGIAALAEAAGARGADALCAEPAARIVHRRSGALRSLFAIDAAVPQSAARIRRPGVRRGARGGHAGRRAAWARRSTGSRRRPLIDWPARRAREARLLRALVRAVHRRRCEPLRRTSPASVPMAANC